MPDTGHDDSIKANALDVVMMLAAPTDHNLVHPPVSAMLTRPSQALERDESSANAARSGSLASHRVRQSTPSLRR